MATRLDREYVKGYTRKNRQGGLSHVTGHFETRKETHHPQALKQKALYRRQLAIIDSALQIVKKPDVRERLATKRAEVAAKLRAYLERHPELRGSLATRAKAVLHG